MIKFNAGDIVPATGFYRIVDRKGKSLGQLFLNKGERFPLIKINGCYYTPIF
jgi:hypothetical protein